MQEEAEKRLEAEMQKRRERIEKWRAEKKKRELEAAKKEAEKGTLGANVPKVSIKAWSLEDDDEEEDGENREAEGKMEEVQYCIFWIFFLSNRLYLKDLC